jgi:hypothetical protein
VVGVQLAVRLSESTRVAHAAGRGQPTAFTVGAPEPASWSVPIAGGELVVSEATGDLRTMPPRMTEAATSLIGTAPVYCLSIFAGAGQSTGSTVVVDDKETAALVRQIVNAFAARWPAVLSDNTTNPMIPDAAVIPAGAEAGLEAALRRVAGSQLAQVGAAPNPSACWRRHSAGQEVVRDVVEELDVELRRHGLERRSLPVVANQVSATGVLPSSPPRCPR